MLLILEAYLTRTKCLDLKEMKQGLKLSYKKLPPNKELTEQLSKKTMNNL